MRNARVSLGQRLRWAPARAWRREDPVKCCAAVCGVLALLLSFGGGAEATNHGDGPLSVVLPAASWALEIRASGFVIEKDLVSAGADSHYVFAVNRRTGLNLSVRLERGGSGQSPAECRDRAWQDLKARSPLTMEHVKLTEAPQMALVEYLVKQYQGLQVDQKHLHAHLAKGDTCIGVHVSKVQFTPGDQPLFQSILNGIRVRDNAGAASPASQQIAPARSYRLAHATLELSVPPSWNESIRQSGNEAATITFTPAGGEQFRVLITVISDPGGGRKFNDPRQLRAIVQQSGQKLMSTAAEQTLIIEEFRGPEAVGYFYALTDKALVNTTPQRGDYTYMTQGVVGLADMMLTFTVLSNVKEGTEHRGTIAMLKGARQKSVASRETQR